LIDLLLLSIAKVASLLFVRRHVTLLFSFADGSLLVLKEVNLLLKQVLNILQETLFVVENIVFILNKRESHNQEHSSMT